MNAAFGAAQARYDAAEPTEPALAPPALDTLDDLINVLATEGQLDESGEVHALGYRQATVGIWVGGHEYSLTLNRED